MNEQTDDLAQADKDILTYTLSDDALEATAGPERGLPLTFHTLSPARFTLTAADRQNPMTTLQRGVIDNGTAILRDS